jgi:xylose isomerase
MSPFDPTREDRFTFGLWTVGNPGRDTFGPQVRNPPTPVEIVQWLSKLGARGVNLHDNDLVPFGASFAERDRIVAEFKRALDDNGMVVPMATTNLFSHPVFKAGAFTSTNPKVRAFAIQKAVRAMDLGVELGAEIFVAWGGREGSEVDAACDPVTALGWYRDAINLLCEYAGMQGYQIRVALEAKPNEPRGSIYLPTTGSMLAFIDSLDYPAMVGVNPEVAHEQMSGLNFVHAVAEALYAKKLFHIDLNGQRPGRFDQDLRFGSDNLKDQFYLVQLLERHGYAGPRHFDAHALRTEDMDGVWRFAHACMRMYLILKMKVRQFDSDPYIQELLSQMEAEDGPVNRSLLGAEDAASRKASLAVLGNTQFDPERLGARRCHLEHLDRLVDELLLGVPHD